MKINEVVNTNVFKRGFMQTKSFIGKNGIEYILVATHGALPYIPGKKASASDQFRIEAYNGTALVGWVNFENINNNLEALDLVVNEKRQGIATAMYQFAKELGNDINPSSKQTPDGRAFWAGKK